MFSPQFELDLLAFEARNSRLIHLDDLKSLDLSLHETSDAELLKHCNESFPKLQDILRSRLLLELYRQIKERGFYVRVHQIGGVHPGLVQANFHRHFCPVGRWVDIDDILRKPLEALCIALAVKEYSGRDIRWEDVFAFERKAKDLSQFTGSKIQVELSRTFQGMNPAKREWCEPPRLVMQMFFGGPFEFSERVARCIYELLHEQEVEYCPRVDKQ